MESRLYNAPSYYLTKLNFSVEIRPCLRAFKITTAEHAGGGQDFVLEVVV